MLYSRNDHCIILEPKSKETTVVAQGYLRILKAQCPDVLVEEGQGSKYPVKFTLTYPNAKAAKAAEELLDRD